MFNQYEEVLKAIKNFSVEELEKGVVHTEVSSRIWANMAHEKIEEILDKNLYKSRDSFRKSINTQVKNAIDKLNEVLSSRANRPVVFVSDSTLYITDLVFKFYVDWKVGREDA